MSEEQAQLDNLDKQIHRLKVEYELFFQGVNIQEPLALEKEVQQIILQLSRVTSRKAAFRFRFQGLSARYYSFVDLWNRRKRKREEDLSKSEATAPLSDKVPGQVIEQYMPALLPLQSASPAEHILEIGSEDESQQVEAIYSDYMKALKDLKTEAIKIKLEDFSQMLKSQANRLLRGKLRGKLKCQVVTKGKTATDKEKKRPTISLKLLENDFS